MNDEKLRNNGGKEMKNPTREGAYIVLQDVE
jgi:hypothetical protein